MGRDLTVNPFWASQAIPGWNSTFRYFANQTQNKTAKAFLLAPTQPISMNTIAARWAEGMLVDAKIAKGGRARSIAREMVAAGRDYDFFPILGSGEKQTKRVLSALTSNSNSTVKKISTAALENPASRKALTSIAAKTATYGLIATRVATIATPIGWGLLAVDAGRLMYMGARTIYDSANNINRYLEHQIENMRGLEFNQPLSYGYQSQPAATERQMAVRAIAQTGGRIGSYGFGNEAAMYSR